MKFTIWDIPIFLYAILVITLIIFGIKWRVEDHRKIARIDKNITSMKENGKWERKDFN